MKKALIVGINKYPLLGNCDLAGCVNDALDLHAVVQGGARLSPEANPELREVYGVYGYHKARVLLDEQAAKADILSGIDWLFDGVREGDELLFTYSGHGTQVRDLDGDEPDRLDEALCPYDTSMADNNSLLLDDELYSRFKALPRGVPLTCLADCCHFGPSNGEHGIRDINSGLSRYVNFGAGRAPRERVRRIAAAPEGRLQRHVLLSGCKDTETSADAYFAGRPNGALTWALLQAVKQNPRRTWQDAHADILRTLKAEGFSQHPQLSGLLELLNRPLFGGVAA